MHYGVDIIVCQIISGSPVELLSFLEKYLKHLSRSIQIHEKIYDLNLKKTILLKLSQCTCFGDGCHINIDILIPVWSLMFM